MHAAACNIYPSIGACIRMPPPPPKHETPKAGFGPQARKLKEHRRHVDPKLKNEETKTNLLARRHQKLLHGPVYL